MSDQPVQPPDADEDRPPPEPTRVAAWFRPNYMDVPSPPATPAPPPAPVPAPTTASSILWLLNVVWEALRGRWRVLFFVVFVVVATFYFKDRRLAEDAKKAGPAPAGRAKTD